ncbi:hypothetical protein O181_026950 [Austropuccinia psidii MF-1]|uniref:Uncharacterized protein n=1 Tax=Austropuccinia psidii MF-1 TaxID=1389203 RepID=A0A9Q3CQE1_9BASI|nr:hypothetical protein [Austropuccinia psidii MF-1]
MIIETPIPFFKYFGGFPSFTKNHVKLTHDYDSSRLTAPDQNPSKPIIKEYIFEIPINMPSSQSKLLDRETLIQQNNANSKALNSIIIPPWLPTITKYKT